MSFVLYTDTNPGQATWTPFWVVAASGVLSFGPISLGTNTVTVTVPAGLEGAPLVLGWASDVSAYPVSGGRLHGSISGTTLTITAIGQGGPFPGPAGLNVSYAVLSSPGPLL